MVAGIWDDCTVQGYLREWVKNIERCVKRVHPRCNVDRFGRMHGVTNTGGIITLNYEPDGIPQTVLPTSREAYYTYFNALLQGFYPMTGAEYVAARLAGTSPGSLQGCTP